MNLNINCINKTGFYSSNRSFCTSNRVLSDVGDSSVYDNLSCFNELPFDLQDSYNLESTTDNSLQVVESTVDNSEELLESNQIVQSAVSNYEQLTEPNETSEVFSPSVLSDSSSSIINLDNLNTYDHVSSVYNSLPSYRTYPSVPNYNSLLNDGERFCTSDAFDNLEDSGSVSSVDTGLINQYHMVSTRAGHATIPTERLCDRFENDQDSTRLCDEMDRCRFFITRDSNNTLQRISKDLTDDKISKGYARKAIDLVYQDAEDLHQEVCETEATVLESLWPSTYDVEQDNPWSLNNNYHNEIENMNSFRELPFHLEEINYDASQYINMSFFRELPYHLEDVEYSVSTTNDNHLEDIYSDININNDNYTEVFNTPSEIHTEVVQDIPYNFICVDELDVDKNLIVWLDNLLICIISTFVLLSLICVIIQYLFNK